MLDVIRVGSSVIRYRGGSGQWAWVIHRAAGLGVLAFLMLHIVDIFVAAFGPALFNDLLFLYKGPVARLGEILLAFGLIYHALNGLRIIAADFIPKLASLRVARNLFYLQILLFLALFVPASMMMVTTLPQPEFHNNLPIALVVTFGILALPGAAALVASFMPAGLSTRLDADASVGNYADGIARILKSKQRRPMNRGEMNIWLFMRVSGSMLVVLALLHLFMMHFVIGVEQISFDTIVQRWNDPTNPLAGLFWRAYDLALLAFAFTHGMLGARYAIGDYVHSLGWRRLLLVGAALAWLALMLMGAGIIFSFRATFA